MKSLPRRERAVPPGAADIGHAVRQQGMDLLDDAAAEGAAPPWCDGRAPTGVSGTRVENNTITRSASAALTAVKATGAVSRGNVLAENNNAEGRHDTLTGGRSENAAGGKSTSTSPLNVRDNIFDHNDGSGFWCDLDCADVILTRNVSRNNTGNDIFYEVSRRAIIASNVLTGNSEAGLPIAGADGVRSYNNTLYGNAAPPARCVVRRRTGRARLDDYVVATDAASALRARPKPHGCLVSVTGNC